MAGKGKTPGLLYLLMRKSKSGVVLWGRKKSFSSSQWLLDSVDQTPSIFNGKWGSESLQTCFLQTYCVLGNG